MCVHVALTQMSHICTAAFLNHFIDKWEAEVGDGVVVVAITVVEVVVGVTVGSMPDTPEGITNQTAPLRHILTWNSTAGMVIHWEHWPAVTMVSYSFIFNNETNEK